MSDETTNSTPDMMALSHRLHMLREEHRDLDNAIHAMNSNPYSDQVSMQRMKKRKLKIRDMITYVENQMIPDMDA